jgi:hypothetical protein
MIPKFARHLASSKGELRNWDASAQPPCKGGPRTLRVPRLGLPRGPDPLAPRARSSGEKGLTPRMEDVGAWGRFRAHLSAASASWRSQASLGRAITRSASQANRAQGWRGGCAQAKVVRPTGIEPMSARWHRAALPLSYGRWSDGSGAQSRTRTCEARRHLIYSQASLPLEYLCRVGRGGRTCTCGLRVMSPASCCCSTPRRMVRAIARIARTCCWRKADGSNATPLGCPPVFKTGCRPLQRNLPYVGRLGAT